MASLLQRSQGWRKAKILTLERSLWINFAEGFGLQVRNATALVDLQVRTEDERVAGPSAWAFEFTCSYEDECCTAHFNRKMTPTFRQSWNTRPVRTLAASISMPHPIIAAASALLRQERTTEFEAMEDGVLKLKSNVATSRPGMYVCTSLCMVTHIARVRIICMYGYPLYQSLDQPGKVTNPARGQLNREN